LWQRHTRLKSSERTAAEIVPAADCAKAFLDDH
jgi:hypothetical protein